MQTPRLPVDLLVVGALTIDRFADGSTAPGGSVLHAGLAAANAGAAVTALTVCGDEPAARDGLDRLAALHGVIHQPAAATATFRHDDRGGRRVLTLEVAPEPIRADTARAIPRAGVALFAPIAGELPADVVHGLRARLAPRVTVLLIQGWLRRLRIGEAVEALPLDALEPQLWAELSSADAIVVSGEDLAEARGDAQAQAAALRARLGRGPVLALTLGTDGYLVDDPNQEAHVVNAPRRVVDRVSTVGAGDTFGAAFALRLAAGEAPVAAADGAAEQVAAMLATRAGSPRR